MFNKATALEMGQQMAEEGWEVSFYPKAFTSKSRNVILPALVASKDGTIRKVSKYGTVTEFGAES